MLDYSKAKLYAIRSHKTEDIYIGSSCSQLAKRLHGHRKDYESFKKGRGRSYITSFEIIKHPDHYIELIRAVPCSSKEELHKLEGDEIRSTRCVNKSIPGRTSKQYYRDNRADKLQKVKQYHIENREKILAKKKQYRIEKKDIRNCLCGGSYNCAEKRETNRHCGSERHKSYVKDFYTRLNEQLTQ